MFLLERLLVDFGQVLNVFFPLPRLKGLWDSTILFLPPPSERTGIVARDVPLYSAAPQDSRAPGLQTISDPGNKGGVAGLGWAIDELGCGPLPNMGLPVNLGFARPPEGW